MAATGVFRVPREFKDEDKWFRYFNKKQAVVLVLTLLADYRMLVAASEHGLVLPALVAAVLLTLLAAGIVMVQLPVDVMFLTGGGITLDQWLFRIILRKSRRVIYTKHSCEKEEED
jgi:hypothetical protein